MADQKVDQSLLRRRYDDIYATVDLTEDEFEIIQKLLQDVSYGDGSIGSWLTIDSLLEKFEVE